MGVIANPDNTFLTDDIGVSQILFTGSPRSLLFVHGGYRFASTPRSHSYDRIVQKPFRWQISALSYAADDYSLDEVWNAIQHLDRDTATKAEIQNVIVLLSSYESRLAVAMTRRDPYSVISPAISSLALELRKKLSDLQRQIIDLEIGVGTELPDSAFYPKIEVDALLANKANAGDLAALESSKLSQVEYDSHITLSNPHATTYRDVGSPSYDEFLELKSRLSRLEYDEQVFSWEGPLQEIEDIGLWYPWDPITITAVRISLKQPPVGQDVIVDVRVGGQSIFETPDQRPTILENGSTDLVRLNHTVNVTPEERLSVDIDQIGTQEPGIDLLVQVRYVFYEPYQIGIQIGYGKACLALERASASADPDLSSGGVARAVERTSSRGGHLIRPVTVAASSTSREASSATGTIT